MELIVASKRPGIRASRSTLTPRWRRRSNPGSHSRRSLSPDTGSQPRSSWVMEPARRFATALKNIRCSTWPITGCAGNPRKPGVKHERAPLDHNRLEPVAPVIPLPAHAGSSGETATVVDYRLPDGEQTRPHKGCKV